MNKYKVTNVYKYTGEITVEAESEKDALELALGMVAERSSDDWLYDSSAILIKD